MQSNCAAVRAPFLLGVRRVVGLESARTFQKAARPAAHYSCLSAGRHRQIAHSTMRGFTVSMLLFALALGCAGEAL